MHEYSFNVSSELVKTDTSNIMEFNYKYEFSPFTLGLSADTRNLSVFVSNIIITAK